MPSSKLKTFRKAIQEVEKNTGNAIEAIKKDLTTIPCVIELEIPIELCALQKLEHLNLFNNCIKVGYELLFLASQALPSEIVNLTCLKSLNLGMNKLYNLPRGFGAFPSLEILDLTYNNLNESSLPENFFNLVTLRFLYLSDNDFEKLPPEVGKLLNLEILALRNNDLIMLPAEIGNLKMLKELHLQGNRLTALPPELDIGITDDCWKCVKEHLWLMTRVDTRVEKSLLDLCGPKNAVKLYGNPWVTPIENQLQVNVAHVLDYIQSETYGFLYRRQMASQQELPPVPDKSEKISRK